MSQVQGDIDLSVLSRGTQDVKPPKRSPARWLVPAVILLTFGGVLGSTLLEELTGGVEVDLVRPEPAAPGESMAAAKGAVVVQAAGWVEPDPFPMHVSVLAKGILTEVLVEESDVLEAGDPVGKLLDEDARLARDLAQAGLDQARADLAARLAEAEIAEGRLEAAIEVTEALAVARAELAEDRVIAEKQAAAVDAGRAQVELAEEELVVQRDLAAAGVSGLRQVELAEAALREAKAKLAGLEAEARRALREVEKAAAKEARAAADVEHRFEDRLRAQLALPAVEGARGKVAAAEVALAQAELELERMVVRTPVAGVVLERLAVPGMVMDASGPSHEVCSLYDPASLRVRVDVPQADVAQLRVGQDAEIVTQARGGAPYRGEVLRIVQRADIQKVTLEVQVRITDGDAWIRPEMLAQVRFLSDGASTAETPGTGHDVVTLPTRLVESGAVWVLDPIEGVARRRSVVTQRSEGGTTWISEGVDLSTKVIDPRGAVLEEGTRIQARKEGTQ